MIRLLSWCFINIWTGALLRLSMAPQDHVQEHSKTTGQGSYSGSSTRTKAPKISSHVAWAAWWRCLQGSRIISHSLSWWTSLFQKMGWWVVRFLYLHFIVWSWSSLQDAWDVGHNFQARGYQWGQTPDSELSCADFWKLLRNSQRAMTPVSYLMRLIFIPNSKCWLLCAFQLVSPHFPPESLGQWHSFSAAPSPFPVTHSWTEEDQSCCVIF